jgi:hypothetical protein
VYVIIDYRNIAKIAAYSILSGEIACTFPTEISEIANRLVKRLLCLRLDYPTSELIFANDKKPYWRTNYIDNWYTVRAMEPVPYKGNRARRPWIFTTPEADMEAMYDKVLRDMAYNLEATVVEDVGLEADDIFGLYAKNNKECIGISTDSDWRQLCSSSITVIDPSTDTTYNTPYDVRLKFISGDRGDNITGCPKVKKNGSPGTTNWGVAGAEKLLQNIGWENQLDRSILERNKVVITLPCPLWNVAEAYNLLPRINVSTGAAMDAYGVTATVRQELRDKAVRNMWIKNLRVELQLRNIKHLEKEE